VSYDGTLTGVASDPGRGTAREDVLLSSYEDEPAVVLDAFPDPVVVVDESFVVVSSNPEADRFFGHEPGGLLGRSALDWVHEPDRIEAAERAAALLAGQSQKVLTVRMIAAESRQAWVEVRGRRFETADGGRRAVLGLRDVGWRLARELSSARSLSRSLLLAQLAVQFQNVTPGQFVDALATALGQIGDAAHAEVVDVHEVDADGTAHVLRGRWVDDHSRTASTSIAPAQIDASSVPVWTQAMDSTDDMVILGGDGAPRAEMHTIDPALGSGISVPLREGDRLAGTVTISWPHGTVLGNDDRDFVAGAGRVIGSAVVRVRAMQTLLESEALFRDLFRSSSAVMYLIDPSSLRLVDANAAAASFYGYAREEMLGMDLHRLTVHSADDLRAMIEAIRAEEQVTVIEEHQMLADGTVRVVEIHSTPMRINRRSFDLAIVQDVTDQRRAHQELERMASTDDLTGALNRRRFLEVAGAELARCERYGRDASLLMLDLDHFKSVNDTRGHLAGDEVLVAFADACSALMREQDRFARLGGEEFAVFLPETALAAALALAERVRAAAEGVGVTVSIGAAQWEPGSDVEVLYAMADKQLYAAKQDGRNRVVG